MELRGFLRFRGLEALGSIDGSARCQLPKHMGLGVWCDFEVYPKP